MIQPNEDRLVSAAVKLLEVLTKLAQKALEQMDKTK